MYGFGNWTEVAEHVGTKTKLQCIDHYNGVYMNSPCFPLPVSVNTWIHKYMIIHINTYIYIYVYAVTQCRYIMHLKIKMLVML